MTEVEIEYCVPCGFLNRATDLADVLLSSFGDDLDRVTLVTGDHGVFRVSVGGEVVYDKDEDDYDVDEITRQVRTAI